MGLRLFSQILTKLTSGFTHRVEMVFFLSVLLLATLAIALLIYQLMVAQRYQPNISAVRPPPATSASSYNEQDIINSQLFGEAKPQQLSQRDLPSTQVALQLRGVFTAPVDDQAGAIIEGEGRPAEYYKVGMEISEGITLHRVYSNRVLISNQGELENLYFPTVLTAPTQSPPTQSPATPGQTRPPTSAAPPAQQPSNDGAISQEQKQTLIRQRLEELRSRARSKQR